MERHRENMNARKHDRKELKRLELQERLLKHKQEEDKKLDQFRALIQGGIKIKKRSILFNHV